MNQTKRLRGLFWPIPIFFVLATICSCSDDYPAKPHGDVDPNYENIWPAAAGRYWEYDVKELVYERDLILYERLEDMPPIPSMEELYDELHVQYPGAVSNSSRGVYRLGFAPAPTSSRDSLVLVAESAMEFVEGYAWPPYPLIYSFDMEILWTRAEEKIAAYSENGLSWLFMEGKIEAGNEFEALLHEDAGLEIDISLKTRVWRIGPTDLLGDSYPNVIECFYILDQGYVVGTGPGGGTTGYGRVFYCGLIVYVPGVGPVYCKQKAFQPGVLVESTADLLSSGREG